MGVVVAMKVLKARLRRWAHQLWIGYRPWRWGKTPPCRAIDHSSIGPDTDYRRKTLWLSCTCGREFYCAKGHDPEKFTESVGDGG